MERHVKPCNCFSGCFVDELILEAVYGNCEPAFSASSNDVRSFEPGSWQNATENRETSADPWKYHTMAETGALPYAGRYYTYPGSS